MSHSMRQYPQMYRLKKSFLKTVTTVIVTTVMFLGCIWMRFECYLNAIFLFPTT